jgi:glutaminyl-peptide cyclotransferase
MRFHVLGASILIAASILSGAPRARAAEPIKPEKSRRADGASATVFDEERAIGYLTRICDIGPRISGTEGMEKQQQLIADHFSKLKAKVSFQSFDAPHPLTRKPVRMANLIVSWDSEAKDRVLVACHYDTRPHADRDPNPQLAEKGAFLGANDGASGVALLMELGHHIRQIKPTYGVDFVFFDGEELVYNDFRDPYFLGSEYFSKDYRDHPPEHKYVCGVLVDMIGGKTLQIYQERNSLELAPEITTSIWQTAKRLKIREFMAKPKHEVRDDHLSLNQIAGIPTCDIIDFDFPHWHTTRDVPAACSGASLAKVGRVLLAWLEEVPAPPARAEKKRKSR